MYCYEYSIHSIDLKDGIQTELEMSGGVSHTSMVLAISRTHHTGLSEGKEAYEYIRQSEIKMKKTRYLSG